MGPSWPWSYGSWICNYLCNQCLLPLMLWVWILIRARRTTLCDKVCHWLATGRWFSLGTLISSTNKTNRNDITEILLKIAINTITLTPNSLYVGLTIIIMAYMECCILQNQGVPIYVSSIRQVVYLKVMRYSSKAVVPSQKRYYQLNTLRSMPHYIISL